MTTSKRATKRPLPPATGTCRWMSYIDPSSGNRWLHIAATTPSGRLVKEDYEVELLKGAIRLHKLDEDFNVVTYTVSTTWGNDNWTCDCPDATNRPERLHNCKHVRALKSAMSQMPK